MLMTFDQSRLDQKHLVAFGCDPMGAFRMRLPASARGVLIAVRVQTKDLRCTLAPILARIIGEDEPGIGEKMLLVVFRDCDDLRRGGGDRRAKRPNRGFSYWVLMTMEHDKTGSCGFRTGAIAYSL